MSDTKSQEKGSSSENEDPVTPKMPLSMLKPGMKVPLNTLKPYDQGDIIPITEGDGESPRKKRP